MVESTIEKKKVPPKPQLAQPQKKKKKNAPDAPQPKWLFPPDEENPVLTPKAKTPEEVQREKDEREKSLNYMKRRVHAAPDRPAPPHELLTLVGIFLTDFGFNSTSRLFTNERAARKELNGWEDPIGTKIEKGTPTLEQIYREWYLEWKIKKLAKDETSSSESGSSTSDSDSDAGVATQVNGAESSDDDSEASSDGLGGSDVEMKNAPKARGKKGKDFRKSASSSVSSSSSDSDADDEAERKQPNVTTTAPIKTKTKTKKSTIQPNVPTTKPTLAAMVNKLKRKAPDSNEESNSDSSLSSKDKKPVKKSRSSATNTATAASLPNETSDSSSDSSSEDSEDSEELEEEESSTVAAKNAGAQSDSSSSESSESESSEEERKLRKNPTKSVPTIPKASSDSSATINGDITKASASSSSETSSSATSDSETDDKSIKKAPLKKEKKHTGAKPTPLAELSAKGVHGHVSNQYQSYEYADKAFQDLSVTRGKGFTKEKNKKKRGSYRGGPIDTSGGKGFKFED